MWFGDGETNRTNDSRCQTEDLGDDAMKASTYGIMNLKRELPQLPTWTYQSGDIYGSNLSSMYAQVVNQFYRYCNHVMRNLGGVYCDYKTVDQTGAVYSDEPREKQERALQFLIDNVVKQPKWLINVSYANRLMPDIQSYLNRIGTRLVSSMVEDHLINRLTSTYPVNDYLPALVKAVFASTDAKDSYSQALQRTVVEELISYFKSKPNRPATGVVLQQLRSLQHLCNARQANPHFAALADMIDRALVVK